MKTTPELPFTRRALWAAALTLLGALATNAPLARAEEKVIPSPPPVVEKRVPLFAKVDHFFATAPDAEALFLFFRDTLGLAPAWPYRNYGNFASGAVSLGNVAFEFVTWKVPAGEVVPTEFAAFAFEPVGDTPATVVELARRGVTHDKPEATVMKDKTGHDFGWINTGLSGLAPPGVAFVCDYSDRQKITDGRAAASAELAKHLGGPLGVVAMKEIVLGVPDVAAASREWRKLVDSPQAESGDTFAFGTGPRIRLVQASTPGILRIVIQVRSIESASAFLAGKGLLEKETDGNVSIARAATKGLHVVLVVN